MATALNQFLNAATANNVRCNNQWEAEFISGYDDVDKVLKTAVMFGSNFSIPGRGINYARCITKASRWPTSSRRT